MKHLTILLIAVLGIAINSYSQSYEFPPKLVFLNNEDNGKPTVALLSNNAHGKFTYGDTLGFKMHNLPEYSYAYKQYEIVKIEELYETMYIPLPAIDSIKVGGVEYIRINQTYYKYNHVQRQLQADQAKQVFK